MKGYSNEYLECLRNLGLSYAPKTNMFGVDVTTLLPGCILVTDQNGVVIQNTSWYDMLANRPNCFSLAQAKSGIHRYFENKKTFLLTSGGVDSAVLIQFLRNIKDIQYATYYFETTGGNNSPEDAQRLLEEMSVESGYRHGIYRVVDRYKVPEKKYEQDVDYDLMKRLNLVETETFVACGQNCDSIIAPGFIKSDSLFSTFRNWGLIGGSKAIVINTMLVLFRFSILRNFVERCCRLASFFCGFFSDIVIDYTARGFYFGLFSTVPFIYSKKKITQELIQSYDNINSLFINGLRDDSNSLILLRLYSYSVYAMQNQRGVNAEGYKYVLPFHSAQFIGYCLNRKLSISEIWNPKRAMINFLREEGLIADFSFYRKNKRTDSIVNTKL